ASSGLHFHLINPTTGHRIRMVTQDAETEEEVSRSDLVKGYEFEKDRYVILEDEDFEQARIESSSTLNISKFVEAGSIDPIYFDTSYYVAPDGEAGLDVFIVLRDAIRKARVAALSRVVIAQRERAVAILPSGKGLVCHTLHDPHDLWDAAPLWEEIPDTRPEADMVTLATQLIGRQHGRFQPDDTIDRYEARLREVIDAKLKGEGITPDEPEEPDRDNVIDLMAALKASLGQAASKPSHRPAASSRAKTAGTKPPPSKPSHAKKSARKRAS
ncbi:MAG TPA: Ku protein, partial [Rhodopila sp.]|nr:Ku protein [Rhodopila sp.]